MSATLMPGPIVARLPTRRDVELAWLCRVREASEGVEQLERDLREAREAQTRIMATANTQAGVSLRAIGAVAGFSGSEICRRIRSLR
jgi:hypothetical protein